MELLGGRGVLKFVFGRDVPLWNFKVDPYNFSRKKQPIHIPVGPIFKNFLNMIQFWLKFVKSWKNWPVHIPNSTFYKGSFIYQEADFATHVGSTFPKVLLYWVPPHPPSRASELVEKLSYHVIHAFLPCSFVLLTKLSQSFVGHWDLYHHYIHHYISWYLRQGYMTWMSLILFVCFFFSCLL